MSKKLINTSFLWFIYAALSFPAFYFVYKFGDPNFGTNDFFSYYKLYENWDIAKVDAPFNMRLVSSFFVYLFNKLGFHYNTEIAFNQTGVNKQVLFNAILFNYLCVVSTCVVIYQTLQKHIKDTLLSFFGGALYLLGFGTLFYELMPITDALSVLLFAVTFYYYQDKSYWILLPLIVLVIQREYVFMALAVMAIIDFIVQKDKFYVITIVACLICFVTYLVLRKTLFYTPKYDHQASAVFFLESLLKIKIPILQYVRQTLMTLNLFIIYVGLILYKKMTTVSFDKVRFWTIIALFSEINIISFAAVFGNNTGRYFYILVPLVIYQLIIESRFLFEANASDKFEVI
jgi:hypothetical protein